VGAADPGYEPYVVVISPPEETVTVAVTVMADGVVAAADVAVLGGALETAVELPEVELPEDRAACWKASKVF
jgi:hypothetical protein